MAVMTMTTLSTPRVLALALALPLACDRGAVDLTVQKRPLADVPEDSKPVPKTSSAQGTAVPGAAAPQDPAAPAGPAMPAPGRQPAAAPATARRYIAIFDKSPDERCPAATNRSWSGDRLFGSGDALTLMNRKAVKLPKQLERFCRYVWRGKASPTSQPTFDATWTAKRISMDADLDVLLPQTAYLGGDAAERDAAAAAFRQRSGILGSGAASTVHLQTGVAARVAIIDSVGFADAGRLYASAQPRQRHGLSMAALVHDVRCPNGEQNCREPLFHTQAFPYVGSSPLEQAGGGPLGSIGSLAHALGEAVIRWRGLGLPNAPLILNMSVAWDPEYGADLTPEGQEATHSDLLLKPSPTVPASVQAVHAVLVYASCLDALAIAAAGNNTGAPCEQLGAMAPASWERYPRPDAARCQELFGDELPARRPGDPAISDPGALVYAAGGVTADGQPIPVARPGSTPPRVLPALQAVAGAGTRQTDAWTGTSVATAALSGLAAAIWTHYPALTPGQVIGLITRSGEATSLPARLPAGAGMARLVTGHGAFAQLCAARPGTPACTNPYMSPVLPVASAAAIGAATSLQCTETSMSCGGEMVRVYGCDGGGAATANVPAPTPWLRPQPDIPYCPICPVRGGKLQLSLNPDHNVGAATLLNPTFEFRRADSSYVRVGLGPITSGTDVDLMTIAIAGGTQTIAEALTANNVTAATLVFYVADTDGNPTRATSAVPVTRQ